mmetsp:Transcript_16661/g.32198  ORF Transcript_16661/g.32198 Transcript_16661/m.32198 type:complete len:212 (-) Transcript_16661:384-1019(-)
MCPRDMRSKFLLCSLAALASDFRCFARASSVAMRCAHSSPNSLACWSSLCMAATALAAASLAIFSRSLASRPVSSSPFSFCLSAVSRAVPDSAWAGADAARSRASRCATLLRSCSTVSEYWRSSPLLPLVTGSVGDGEEALGDLRWDMDVVVGADSTIAWGERDACRTSTDPHPAAGGEEVGGSVVVGAGVTAKGAAVGLCAAWSSSPKAE